MSSVIKSTVKTVVPDRVMFDVSPPIVRLYARAMTWYVSDRHHTARIDPFQLLAINPQQINTKLTTSGRECFAYSNAISEIVSGSWDKHVQPLAEYDLYTAFVDHFVEGTEWKNTDFYRRVERDLQRGEYKWGCENIADFEARLVRLEQLYDQIAAHGYRTQAELRNQHEEDPTIRTIHRYWPPSLHEVSIDIGRDGELILHDGRHRFTIAQVQKINQIPVRVKSRHEHWQLIRDRYVETGQLPNDELATHPDILTLEPASK
ncbi:hypothetical protein [Natronorubrum texcoconense]|nr:hypothetical protein [Natronorubrum texcoconense]